ncbi:BamA/TamA family outer membrane protein [Rhodopirellula sp. MGV]|uniref:BamA/TamA family outer membrane protein n=1 Tax=Rhodopirellula sp. MGV TaxID=2023130 RepID=UPI000B95E60C|nr:BamA/TamA family outer membrane protein [Rhodopirellula sp. MGV]OYP28997.1 hypothetical protein CGZ80_25680 [Rhodopirellula sp. MGV]PNY37036.1 hypothetical protein C2E31_09925 [Rhodopirellula baltica]
MLRLDRHANSDASQTDVSKSTGATRLFKACAMELKSCLWDSQTTQSKLSLKSIAAAAVAAIGCFASDASAQQFDPYGGGYTQTAPQYANPQQTATPRNYTPSQYQVQPGLNTPPSYTNQPAPQSQQGYGNQPSYATSGAGVPQPQTNVQPAPSVAAAPEFPPRMFGPRTQSLMPGTSVPGSGTAYPPIGTDPVYTPNVRTADLLINGFPARTGRIMLGGAVNSDAGVTGQITIDERNFDISRWPRSFSDLFSGTAFRGAGQTFRLEAAPGSVFDRYSLQFADPNLFGYLPISFSASGFLYDRRFNDWDEERLGAKVSLGYRITPDLSLAVGVGGQNVDISRLRLPGVSAELDALVGDNELYTGNITLTHNTRDNPIQPSEGHYFQFKFEEAFGDFDYARFELEYRTYWLLAERADGSGKQTISYSTQFGYSGDDTPIFEHFFAGGYATLRGFNFRGAGPVAGGRNGIQVGGQFEWLNSVEYMFPITADDAFRGVLFCDFGTVEESVKLDSDTFRVSPGVGFRVAIPALGPAPLAFDFAFPVNKGEFDDERMFSFYMSLIK